MRIEQIEAVVYAVQCRSMQQAADQLHTSVQNISKLIKQFEDELGVQIFVRSRFGLFLTDEGQKVYQYCLAIMHNLTALKNEYITHTAFYAAPLTYPRLNILSEQSSATICSDILEKICHDLSIETAMLISKDAADINKQIEHHLDDLIDEYDIILTNIARNDINKYKKLLNRHNIYFLSEDRIGVRLSDSHILANEEYVTLKEILRHPLIMPLPESHSTSQMQLLIESLGVTLQPKYIVTTPAQANSYIQHNLGYTFVTYNESSDPKTPDYYVSNTSILPLKEPVYIQHVMILPQEFAHSIPAQKFTNSLAKKFRKMYQV